MVQQVNLLKPELLPEKLHVSALQVTYGALAFTVLLGVFSGWQLWRGQQVQDDNAELARQLQQNSLP